MVQAAAPWQVTPSLYVYDGEYLLGDKGILASSRVLLPHKAPSSQETRTETIIVNTQGVRCLWKDALESSRGILPAYGN